MGSSTVSTPLGILTEPDVALKVPAGLGAPADCDVIAHVTKALPDCPTRRSNLRIETKHHVNRSTHCLPAKRLKL